MIDIKKYYNIKKIPFSNDIDVNSLLLTESHKEVLSRLEFAAEEQKFVVFTAECGSGKTTLLRCLKNKLDESKFEFFYLSDSELSASMIYRNMLEQLGINTRYYRGDSKAMLHQQLEFLKTSKKKKVVTVIDEAHLLSKRTIEEVRFLLNYKMDSYSPMALILSGQPELKEKLYRPNYTAVRQRINMVCKLKNLDRYETGEYIKTHLNVVECKTDIFSIEAIDYIFKVTDGRPRAINNICYQALISAAATKERLIKAPLVKNVFELELL
jgi:type II secretory pathway predicted ATPase ExeA